MFRLNFTQKIILGFCIIVLLLSASSGISLYNLLGIKDSTDRVNDNAVPIEKQSNQVQILLLKQAKLSALAFNASDIESIERFRQDYQAGHQAFLPNFSKLKALTQTNGQMNAMMAATEQHYERYVKSVETMLASKVAVLENRDKASAELDALIDIIDEGGALLMEISYLERPKHAETLKVVAGIASRVDGQMLTLLNTLKEVNGSVDEQRLSTAYDDIKFVVDEIELRVGFADQNLKGIDTDGIWPSFLEQLALLKQHTQGQSNMSMLKNAQVKHMLQARAALSEAEKEVSQAVAQIDQLLLAADQQFNELQSHVLNAVSLSHKATIVAWAVLIVLMGVNFNSMRLAIRKKMTDLSKLNSVGQTLATMKDKNQALEEVLMVMHEQVGVGQGSVYFLNKDNKLEVEAYYPPKKIDDRANAKIFELGEGILGKAAADKEILFIPNTNKSKRFVKGRSNDNGKALLCVPLLDKKVLVGVMNFSGVANSVRFEDSDYAFAASVARQLVTTLKNIHMREVIEEQNRTLEKKVEERTASLQQKTNDIAAMLANITQGLFTISKGAIIQPEFSAFLQKIVETEKIDNRSIMDLLFSDTDLGADELNQIATAIDAIIGCDEMMFDFNEHLLRKSVVKKLPGDRNKLLEIDWAPIVLEDEIEKIMVTVRDVTELRALQAQAQERKTELDMIGQILSVSAAKFSGFLTSSTEFIECCRELIEKTDKRDEKVIAELFRNMHTIKGNARTFGFDQVTQSVHEVENSYDQMRKDAEIEWQQDKLLQELAQVEKDIDRYRQVANKDLGHLFDDSTVQVDSQSVEQLLKEAQGLPQLDEKSQHWVAQVCQLFEANINDGCTIDQVIDDVLGSVSSLAVELDKVPPKVVIEHNDIKLPNKIHSLLNNVFMHVMRNAVDHGLENAEQRKNAGKDEQGLITLVATLNNEQVHFSVKDDGRGLAIGHIYNKAIEKGLFSSDDKRPAAETIANLVFDSGFSTASEVTEVSGRGVGMDAVKDFLEQVGGGIKITLDDGDESADFRPFTTCIWLPL